MLRPINKSDEKIPVSETLITRTKQVPAGNGTNNYLTFGDRCKLNLIRVYPDGGNDSYTKDDYLELDLEICYRSYNFGSYTVHGGYTNLTVSLDITWNGKGYSNAFEYNHLYDTYINGIKCYKWVTIDVSNSLFKIVCKYMNKYTTEGIKYLEIYTIRNIIHNTGDMTSFREEYITCYLLEDGSIATPYGNYSKHPNIINTAGGYCPFYGKYGLELHSSGIIIPEFHYLIEKKLLNLKHNYSSPKIYKLNYLFYGGELNYA